jgi:hypothetical protein
MVLQADANSEFICTDVGVCGKEVTKERFKIKPKPKGKGDICKMCSVNFWLKESASFVSDVCAVNYKMQSDINFPLSVSTDVPVTAIKHISNSSSGPYTIY